MGKYTGMSTSVDTNMDTGMEYNNVCNIYVSIMTYLILVEFLLDVSI